jgi:Spy/CpxP family protein refolding chaperone
MSIATFITKSLTTTLLGTSLLVAGGSSAAAAGPDRAEGKRGGKHGGKICRVADCSDEQREAIAAIRSSSKATVKGHKTALKSGREKLAHAFAGDRFTEATADRIEAEMDQHRDAIREAKSDAMVQIHGVLTSEQRKAVSTHMLERKGKHAKRHPGKKGKKVRSRAGLPVSARPKRSQRRPGFLCARW